MKSPTFSRRLSGRAIATLAASAALLVVAAMTSSYGLALGGACLGLLVAFGASSPRRIRLAARFQTNRADPREEDPVRALGRVTAKGRRRVVEWKMRLPEMAAAEGPTAGVSVFRRGHRDLEAVVRFPMFGLQRVGPLEVRISDPCGFAATEATVGDGHELRVYPHGSLEDDLWARSKQMRSALGAYEVSQPGDGFEFFALRDYHVGDRPRDINWKASGRIGRIIVNQHQRENHALVTILLDVRAGTRVGARHLSPFAQQCRAAIAVAAAHLKARDEVRVIAFGDTVHEDHHTGSARRLQGILDMVVGLEPAGNLPLQMVVSDLLPKLSRKAPVIIMSPLVGDPTVAEAVTAMRSRDTLVSAFVPKAPAQCVEDAAMERWRIERQRAEDQLRGLGVHIHEEISSLLAEERRGGVEVTA